MLPLIGLVAIVLLFFAGKIFLFSDFQANSQPIPVSIAPPGVLRADTEASVSGLPPEPSVPTTGGNLILDSDYEDEALVASDDEDQDEAYQSVDGPREEITREIIVVLPPAISPEPPLSQTIQPELEQQPGPNIDPGPAQPVQAQPEAAAPSWMVQIGAYSTRAAAESVLSRVTQEGHRAVVESGRMWHRVLVQAGPTRQDAESLAARLGQSGYPGAFIVPLRRP